MKITKIELEEKINGDYQLIKKINNILNEGLKEEKTNPSVFIYPKIIGSIIAAMINAGRREEE